MLKWLANRQMIETANNGRTIETVKFQYSRPTGKINETAYLDK